MVWSLCVYSHGWVGKCSEILAALSYSVNPRVNKDMMMMMMMMMMMIGALTYHPPHYSVTHLTMATPTNFFSKLANQDIFLLFHKIQNNMFSITHCCVTCLLDFARKCGYANMINGHGSLQSPTGK